MDVQGRKVGWKKVKYSEKAPFFSNLRRRSTDDYDLASEIQDNVWREVKRYYLYLKKHWKDLLVCIRIGHILPYTTDVSG